jgi:hypothetical protein
MTIPNYVSPTENAASEFKLRTTADVTEPAEFEHFAALAGRLLSVPKSEIDAKRAEG